MYIKFHVLFQNRSNLLHCVKLCIFFCDPFCLQSIDYPKIYNYVKWAHIFIYKIIIIILIRKSVHFLIFSTSLNNNGKRLGKTPQFMHSFYKKLIIYNFLLKVHSTTEILPFLRFAFSPLVISR